MNNILCLNKGTKVLMSDGTQKNIETISKFDFVKSFSFETSNIEDVKVTKIAKSYHSIINSIGLSNGQTIECTTDHPIWTVEKGWCSVNFNETLLNYNVQVQELVIGDTCITFHNGQIENYKIVSIDTFIGNYEMYDITGGNNHCFFANGLLVHDENLENLNNIDELIIEQCKTAK